MLKLSLVLPQNVDDLSLHVMKGPTSPLALAHIQVMEEEGENNSNNLALVPTFILIFREDLD
jgi:methionine-rich copper-binding protein CopC